jgi:uncharacterized protein (DUF58 family)
MSFLTSFLRSLYFTRRLWYILWTLVTACVVGYFFSVWFVVVRIVILVTGLLIGLDIWLLFRQKEGIHAIRDVSERLSNGDDNLIHLSVENRYPFPVDTHIIDEIPDQFQKRDFVLSIPLPANGKHQATYSLRPVERGEYHFGDLNVYASSTLGLVSRRYQLPASRMVPVYPSYLQMRRYELVAISNRLTELGIKRIRRIGHTMEFEHIRPYVRGDDVRTMNWKATARRGDPMINAFEDERAQQVYSVIDMGRGMKMPFEGMSLLDYAINASLVISNIAIKKQDKAGLLTYSNQINALLPANRNYTQMARILEVLYNQKTQFWESDFGQLYAHIARHLTQRSLILLFTNFETLSGLKRQLPYLRRIASRHLLVTIFFQNNTLSELLNKPADNVEEVYIKTIAERISFEKRQVFKELEQQGIQPILTTPQDLTVNTINKYLELKARHMI